MAQFAAVAIRCRHCPGRSPVCRHLGEPHLGRRRKEDGVVNTPARPPQDLARHRESWAAAFKDDLLELALLPESEPPAIGGEERVLSTLGARYRRRLEAIQWSEVELGPSTDFGDIDDLGPIWRQGEHGRPVGVVRKKRSAFRGADAQPCEYVR